MASNSKSVLIKRVTLVECEPVCIDADETDFIAKNVHDDQQAVKRPNSMLLKSAPNVNGPNEPTDQTSDKNQNNDTDAVEDKHISSNVKDSDDFTYDGCPIYSVYKIFLFNCNAPFPTHSIPIVIDWIISVCFRKSCV